MFIVRRVLLNVYIYKKLRGCKGIHGGVDVILTKICRVIVNAKKYEISSFKLLLKMPLNGKQTCDVWWMV
jgi:hypothetical protein